MQKLYSSEDIIVLTHLHDLLRQYDIKTIVKQCKMRDIYPAVESISELLVLSGGDYDRAMEIIHKSLSSTEVKESWSCSSCKEKIEGQFKQCWKCGAYKT
jgi:hypothetical protein